MTVTKKTDTKQSALVRNEKGQIVGGTPPAGFNVNPQNRSDGRWKKENSISYNYNFFMAMDEVEFSAWADKKKTVAQAIAYKQVTEAMTGEEALKSTKEITDRTEGKPKQSVELSGENLPPVSLVTWMKPKTKSKKTKSRKKK